MDFKIPEKFSIGGLEYAVQFTDALEENELGRWCGNECKLYITEAIHGVTPSIDRIRQTFFHELTHSILDFTGHYKLNNDEQFVESFSNALYDAIKTMEG